MPQKHQPKHRKTTLFRMLMSLFGILFFIACAKSNDPNSVTWQKGSTHSKSPADLLNGATPEAGVNAAGYVGLGLIGMKSIERAKDLVINKAAATRIDTQCEIISQSGNTITVKASNSGGSCLYWANNETINAAITAAGQITNVSKSDTNTPSLNYKEPESTARQTALTVTENYNLKPGADASKAIFTFNYDGILDFSYFSPPFHNRPVNKNHPIGNGTVGGNGRAGGAVRGNDQARMGGNVDDQEKLVSPSTPSGGRRQPDTTAKATGPGLENKITIRLAGQIDLTDENKPVVIFTKFSVGVEYFTAQDGKNAIRTFTSDISLAAETAAMPTTCGFPEGSMSFLQNFTLAAQDNRNAAKKSNYKPTLNLKANLITPSKGVFFRMPDCTQSKGLLDILTTVKLADDFITTGRDKSVAEPGVTKALPDQL